VVVVVVCEYTTCVPSQKLSGSGLVFGVACWYLRCTSAGGLWTMGSTLNVVMHSGGGRCVWLYGCPAENRASQAWFWSGVCGFSSCSCRWVHKWQATMCCRCGGWVFGAGHPHWSWSSLLLLVYIYCFCNRCLLTFLCALYPPAITPSSCIVCNLPQGNVEVVFFAEED
jgi:hypothetical protein